MNKTAGTLAAVVTAVGVGAAVTLAAGVRHFGYLSAARSPGSEASQRSDDHTSPSAAAVPTPPASKQASVSGPLGSNVGSAGAVELASHPKKQATPPPASSVTTTTVITPAVQSSANGTPRTNGTTPEIVPAANYVPKAPPGAVAPTAPATTVPGSTVPGAPTVPGSNVPGASAVPGTVVVPPPAPPRPAIASGHVIFVDRGHQRVFVFDGSKLEMSTYCSTAAHYPHWAPGDDRYLKPYTPLGDFKVFDKTADHWSKAYLVHMKYALFYDGGRAIHATTPSMYRYLGTPASGGCVRLTAKNARALFHWAHIGDPVHVVTRLPEPYVPLVPHYAEVLAADSAPHTRRRRSRSARYARRRVITTTRTTTVARPARSVGQTSVAAAGPATTGQTR